MEGTHLHNVQLILQRNVLSNRIVRGESLRVAVWFHRMLDIPNRNVVAIGNQLESLTSARCDRLHLLLEPKSLDRKTQHLLDPKLIPDSV